MKPLGFDLQAIAKGTATRPSHDTCPGAMLVITRDEYDQMVSGGEVFVTSRTDIPADGSRADARLHCKGSVLREEKLGRMYFYALCASCSEAERLMRERARKRAETNGR